MSITSPDLPVDQGLVLTEKEFSDALTGELTDEEIARCARILIATKKKWEAKFRSKFRDLSNIKDKDVEEALDLIDQMSDEISYRMATEANVLVTVDSTPVFLEGKGPRFDFLGTVGGPKEMDHDKKEYEVKKAKDKDEDYLGQKETSGKARKRDRNQRKK